MVFVVIDEVLCVVDVVDWFTPVVDVDFAFPPEQPVSIAAETITIVVMHIIILNLYIAIPLCSIFFI